MNTAAARARISPPFHSLLPSEHWKPVALLSAVALSLLHAFPSYDALRGEFTRLTWQAVQIKFDRPTADMSRLFPAGSHAANLTYRMLVPLLAHALRLGCIGVLILSAIAGIVLLQVTLALAWHITASRTVAFFITLATACVWPGVTAFHELRGGYYDSIALCLLVSSMAAESPALSGTLAFLAMWTDERALIAASFLIVYRAFPRTEATAARSVAHARAIIEALLAYAGVRVLLTLTLHYPGSYTGVGPSVFRQQMNAMPLAIWTGLGGLWLLIILALRELCHEKRYAFAGAFGAALLCVTCAALSVADMTRGMSYCLPAVFIALGILSNSARREKYLRRLAILCAAVSFVLPTFYVEGAAGIWRLYPLPIQIARWLSRSV